MPSFTIQSYLNDTTVPVEKRRYALDQINGGTPEKEIEDAINIKYQGKYGATSQIGGVLGKAFGVTPDSSIGKTISGAAETVGKMTAPRTPEQPTQPQAEKGFGERFGEQVLQAPGKMFDIAKEQIVQPVLTSGAKAGLGLSAPIVDPISKAITGKTIQQRLEESPTAQALYGKENVKNLVPKDVTDWAGAATETIANLLVGSEGSALMKASPKGFALLKQLATQGAKFGGVYGAAQGAQVTTDEQGKPLNTAQRIGEIATGTVKGAATGAVLAPLMGTVASKYMNKATGGATKVAGVVTKEGELPTNIEQVVKETWQSGTKPTGKSVDVPISKVGAAMLDTVENKSKLKFTDASGELIEGQLPRTHAEYTQVAQNRMDDIFNQYDAMAKSAGEKGAVVEFTPIAAELNKLVDNQALRIKDPNTIKYAQEMASRLESEGAGTPKNVQETIKMLNSDLQNFYRNPGYESSGRAFVDAAVAKELRTRLDSAISSLEGDGYQDLKNTYGAWSSILDAIEHRATLEARKNKIGLVDSIYNMGSIADLGRALVTRSPASFTTSAMQQAAKFFTKYINSPDAILKRNFTKLEGIVNEGGMPIKGSVPKVKSSIPKELKPLTEKTSFNASEAISNKSLRSGQPPVGSKEQFDLVARERFDIPKLEKISFGGSDRDVYDLGDGNVLKISKSSRGLTQNNSSVDWYAEQQGLIPKTIEVGDNYIVKEKALPPNKATKDMVAKLKKLNLGSPRYNRDFWDNQAKAIEILNDAGYNGDSLLDYGEVLWGDVQAIRNWGTTLDGTPILLDEGSLKGDLVSSHKYSGKNMQDPEFRNIHARSKSAKKLFSDTDKKTMYGIGGAAAAGASVYGGTTTSTKER